MTPPPAAPRPRSQAPAKGSTFEATVESLVYGGAGIARVDGYVVFVDGAAPGEHVRARLTKRKSSHGEAEVVEVLSASPHRVEPPCPHFGRCGGCTWQHVSLGGQQAAKARIVEESLRQIPGIVFEPLVASPLAFGYRNKMEFTFSRVRGEGPLKLGFHEPSDWRDVLDVGACMLAPEPVNRVLAAARAEGERQRLSAWSPFTHRGTLRQLVVRHSVHEDRIIAALLTGDTEGVDFEAFADALCAAAPELKGVVWGINDAISDVARTERVLKTRGEDTFEERLGDLSFRVSMASFFQTNTRGALELYRTAREFLSLTGRERLLDAYCGTGTIGIFCAREAREVYGIEIVKEAVWDARENALRNGLANCTFLAGDMRLALGQLAGAVEGRFDRLVVDPPRGGMDKRALEQLLALQCPVMVYVSCNPTTMARDLQLAVESGYTVERVRPVDMFPQTYHIECVAKCVRVRQA